MADENYTGIEDDSEIRSERTDHSISETLQLHPDSSADGVSGDGTQPAGSFTPSAGNSYPIGKALHSGSQPESTSTTRHVGDKGKQCQHDARQISPPPVNMTGTASAKVEPVTETSPPKPAVINPTNISTPCAAQSEVFSKSHIPTRTNSLPSTPKIPPNASTDSVLYRSRSTGSRIPQRMSSPKDNNLTNMPDSSTDAVSGHSSKIRTIVNSKTTSNSASSKENDCVKHAREFNTTPHRTSNLHHNKEKGGRIAPVFDSASSRKTPLPQKPHQFLDDVNGDGTQPAGSFTPSAGNSYPIGKALHSGNQPESTSTTRLVGDKGKQCQHDARQISPPPVNMTGTASAKVEPVTETSPPKPAVINPTNISTPCAAQSEVFSKSHIPTRTNSLPSTPKIPPNASTDSVLYRSRSTGSRIPQRMSSPKDNNLTNMPDSSTDAVSGHSRKIRTFVNSKTTSNSAGSKENNCVKNAREFNTTPHRTSKLHHNKEKGRRIAPVFDSASSRKTGMPKKPHQFLGKRSRTGPNKMINKKEVIKSKVTSDREEYVPTDDEAECGDNVPTDDEVECRDKTPHGSDLPAEASKEGEGVKRDSEFMHQNRIDDYKALLQLLNERIRLLKKLLAEKYQFYQHCFIQEGITTASPQDVASQIFRMVERSLQRGSVEMFYKMLKAMEESDDQETQSLVKRLRDDMPSKHASSVQEELKGDVDDPRAQTVIPNPVTLKYMDGVDISKKKKVSSEEVKDPSKPTAKVAEENRILREVSDFYQIHFGEEKTKNIKVIAALVQENEIGDGTTYKVAIMSAGTKHNTSSCTLLKQDEANEKYCWNVCDGHAEAVCLHLAHVYLFHELCKAQKDQPTSIFNYSAAEDGYKLKDNIKFHLFVSHPPCGFMTRTSHSVSWKVPFHEKPHVLECSSKILISSCLGIQGPSSVFLLKPICLSSVLILEKENSIETLDTDTINKIFKVLEHELSYTPKTLPENVERELSYTSNTLLNHLRPLDDNKDLRRCFPQGMEYNQVENMQQKVEQMEMQVKTLKQYVESIACAHLKIEKPHIAFITRSQVEIRRLFIGNDLVPDDPKNKAESNAPCYTVLRTHAADDDGMQTGDDKMLKDKFHVNKYTTCDPDEMSVNNKAVNLSDEIMGFYKNCLHSFKMPKQSVLQLRLGYFKCAINFLSKALQISSAIKDMRDKMMQYSLQYTTKFHNQALQFVTPESVHKSLFFTLPKNVCDRYDINNSDNTGGCVATVKDHTKYESKCKSTKSARDSAKNYLQMWNSLDVLNEDGSITLADTDCHLARHIKMMESLVAAGANH